MRKVLILDDEPLHAWEIEQMFENSEKYEVVGVFNDALSAISFINKAPALYAIILDLHLSGAIDGIQVAKMIINREIPIVFITQYKDEFDLNQVKFYPRYSFLVKPFHKFTLLSTIDLLLTLPKEIVESSEDTPPMITVRIGNKREVVDMNAILWVESSRNYCTIHTEKSGYIVRKSLRSLLALLPEDEFIIIHKSFIVRTSAITKIELKEKRVFVNKTPIPIGRTYIKDLRNNFMHLG